MRVSQGRSTCPAPYRIGRLGVVGANLELAAVITADSIADRVSGQLHFYDLVPNGHQLPASLLSVWSNCAKCSQFRLLKTMRSKKYNTALQIMDIPMITPSGHSYDFRAIVGCSEAEISTTSRKAPGVLRSILGLSDMCPKPFVLPPEICLGLGKATETEWLARRRVDPLTLAPPAPQAGFRRLRELDIPFQTLRVCAQADRTTA